MPQHDSLILASPAAAACQLNPGLTRAMSPLLAMGLMDTHLDGWCPMLPDGPRGKRRRMGRLFPRRIVPSVLLGLAAVLDAHREHAHHAPLRVGRAEATRGCRVPLERRGNRRFSSTSCQIAPAERLTVATGGSTPTGAAGSTVPRPAGRVAGCVWAEGEPATSGTKPCVASIQMAGDEPDRLSGVAYSIDRNATVSCNLDR
jgi:hypothetical protein